MNVQCSSTVSVIGKDVYINGVKLPEVPSKSSWYSSVTTIGNKVYINGFEYKNGKWKRTIKAMWYFLFN